MKNQFFEKKVLFCLFAVVMCLCWTAMSYGQGVVNIDRGPLAENELLVDPVGALHEDHSQVTTWITKWYGPDGNYENNGGFSDSTLPGLNYEGAAAITDLMAEGTGGAITDASLSTLEGLLLTQTTDVEWGADHGGTRGWTVFEIDPADADNMGRGGPRDNIETYSVIVINAPRAMTAVMSPAHDDHAQIWLNGEKWYNNSHWVTGSATQVNFNVAIQLRRGANVLVFRCSEWWGDGYMNLHFDDATHDEVTIYPRDATDQQSFFDEIAPLTAATEVLVSLDPSPVELPDVGESLTVNLEITEASEIMGYQATISYNSRTLRFLRSEPGNFLPAGAFTVPPVLNENADTDIDSVTVAATSLVNPGKGSGTLATLTFLVIGKETSILRLWPIILVNPEGNRTFARIQNAQIGRSVVTGDANRDGVVNIQDLVLVASLFGQQNEHADVNGDGIVDIADLVLVAGAIGGGAGTQKVSIEIEVDAAGAIGGGAGAPSLSGRVLETLTAADVRHWLMQAEQLSHTDAKYQHGMRYLQQLLAALTPTETVLLANYPNPFNPETWIPYRLANPAKVAVSIHAADGNLVRTLILGQQPAGIFESRHRAAYWDGKNEVGEPVASGIYFYTLTAGDFTATRKMLIRK